MNILPQSKFGDCSQCEAKGVTCRKIAKDLWCLDKCYKNKKIKEQQDRVNAKIKVTTAVASNKKVVSKVSRGNELQRWFEERREEMTGVCANCGGQSCKNDDQYYKFSIAHILPKAYVPSVKTHKDNWVELCYFGKGCHPQMDNRLLDLMDMNCFDLIITKFVSIYPFIAEKEKRRIPDVLRKYAEIESGVDKGWSKMEKLLNKECSQNSDTEKVL